MLVLPFDVPVDPDAPEARDWLLDELSKQQYQAAKPTFIDLIAQQILKLVRRPVRLAQLGAARAGRGDRRSGLAARRSSSRW